MAKPIQVWKVCVSKREKTRTSAISIKMTECLVEKNATI